MRVLILLSLLGITLAVPRLAAPSNGQRIVGGDPTTISQYPFMSNMQYLWSGIAWSQICAGSLLNSQTVLSAAHCYIYTRASSWRVLLGTSFASSGGSIHPVQFLLSHPQFLSTDNFMDNDIAIVRLAVPAVFSNNVAPVSIAGPNYILADNTPVTAIGWGSLSDQDGPYPEQLQHVNVNIINQTYCTEQYAYLKFFPNFDHWPDVTDNMLCSGIQHIGGKDACQGDSGGPVIHVGASTVLVGITSWGFECAHPQYPGVNARVSRYTDWIVANS